MNKNCLVTRLRAIFSGEDFEFLDDGSVQFNIPILKFTNENYSDLVNHYYFFIGSVGPITFTILTPGINIKRIRHETLLQDTLDAITPLGSDGSTTPATITLNNPNGGNGYIFVEANETDVPEKNVARIKMSISDIGNIREIASCNIDTTYLTPSNLLSLNVSPYSGIIRGSYGNAIYTNIDEIIRPNATYSGLRTLSISNIGGLEGNINVIGDRCSDYLRIIGAQNSTHLTGDITSLVGLRGLVAFDFTGTDVSGSLDDFIRGYMASHDGLFILDRNQHEYYIPLPYNVNINSNGDTDLIYGFGLGVGGSITYNNDEVLYIQGNQNKYYSKVLYVEEDLMDSNKYKVVIYPLATDMNSVGKSPIEYSISKT